MRADRCEKRLGVDQPRGRMFEDASARMLCCCLAGGELARLLYMIAVVGCDPWTLQ